MSVTTRSRRQLHADTDGPAAPTILEVEGVSTGYGPVQVLFGVSMVVRRGERVALLGTNGAGKSTLLRVVSGLMPATTGTVHLDGRDVTASKPIHRVHAGMTYVAGGRAIFPSLTVRENLRMGAYPARRDKRAVTERVEEACDLFTRLGERLDQRAGTLSGGEQQMVALGRALVARPELLLIDELSLGLAPVVLDEIQRMIGVLGDRGMTMLIVEQPLDMAAAVSERAYFMEKGEIRFEGGIAEIMRRGDLARAVFFGDPGNGHDEVTT